MSVQAVLQGDRDATLLAVFQRDWKESLYVGFEGVREESP
jgi:hypothetical protein